MDINNAKTVYMVGIKGAGMAALAQILSARGADVSGSDTEEEFFTDDVLNKASIPFVEGFNAGNIPNNADLVISSNAYVGSDNPEIKEAEKRGLQPLVYPEALSELFNSAEYGIAVCGTHGKSTTTAMLGYILEYSGYDPTVAVGSRVNAWDSNGRAGKGMYFIVEADEYRDAFLNYDPKMILVTNIDYDHPDYFEDAHAYRNSFQKFFFSESVEKIIQSDKLGHRENFNLKLPGEYNQENANLAYAAAIELGVEPNTAKEALEKFSGIARRFESYGEHNGALLFDDYAHHPEEVRSVLKAAKEKYPKKRIVALFQPHTYSRTKKLFDDFCHAFEDADDVYVLRTFSSAREKDDNDTAAKKLADVLNTRYFENETQAAEYLKGELSGECVFLTLGAGSVYKTLSLIKQQ